MTSATTMTFFSTEQLAQLGKAKIPRHIAIIPDGNRRWAKQQEELFNAGHKAGANILIDTVQAAKELGVRAVTFYLFSTENWTRPQEEVAALWWLLQEFLREQTAEMIASGVRLNTIGDLSAISKDVVAVIDETKKLTESGNQIDMILALNYGGRDEIRRAVQKIVDKRDAGCLQKDPITETMIADHLDTASWGDPDLLIRTSGEMRISNFLLWQFSYAEFYVSDVLWPDFTSNHLLEAVTEFQKRERRLGGA